MRKFSLNASLVSLLLGLGSVSAFAAGFTLKREESGIYSRWTTSAQRVNGTVQLSADGLRNYTAGSLVTNIGASVCNYSLLAGSYKASIAGFEKAKTHWLASASNPIVCQPSFKSTIREVILNKERKYVRQDPSGVYSGECL